MLEIGSNIQKNTLIQKLILRITHSYKQNNSKKLKFIFYGDEYTSAQVRLCICFCGHTYVEVCVRVIKKVLITEVVKVYKDRGKS